MSKKHRRKPRSEAIYATTAHEVDSIIISVDPTSGDIEFHSEMVNSYTELTYDRAKGPKVISRTPFVERQMQFRQNIAIEKNFDFVAAIDTNTRYIQENNVSISGVVFCQKVFAVDVDGTASQAWRYWTPFCMEFLNVISKPENTGWFQLIHHIESSREYREIKRIGLIVDSDLDNLPLYNARTTPIYGNMYLPERIRFIYASSERATDLFANQMLRLADKAANMCLDELQAGRIPMNQNRVSGSPYAALRFLYAKNKIDI